MPCEPREHPIHRDKTFRLRPHSYWVAQRKNPCGHMIATLRESKASLSELVALANSGEEVLITVHGQPKARFLHCRTLIFCHSQAAQQPLRKELEGGALSEPYDSTSWRLSPPIQAAPALPGLPNDSND